MRTSYKYSNSAWSSLTRNEWSQLIRPSLMILYDLRRCEYNMGAMKLSHICSTSADSDRILGECVGTPSWWPQCIWSLSLRLKVGDCYACQFPAYITLSMSTLLSHPETPEDRMGWRVCQKKLKLLCKIPLNATKLGKLIFFNPVNWRNPNW